MAHRKIQREQAIRGKPIVIFLYLSCSGRKLCQESLLTVLFHSTTLRKCRKPTCAQTRILLGFADIEMVSDSLPQPREAESKERPRTFRCSRLHTCSVLCFIDRRCVYCCNPISDAAGFAGPGCAPHRPGPLSSRKLRPKISLAA